MPVERCFDWESLALAELAVGNLEAAEEYARRAEEHAAQPGSPACRRRSRCGRARRSCSRAESRARPPGWRTRRLRRPPRSRANLQAAFSRSLEARALIAAGEREAAIALLREVERQLDACGSLRVRDEMRSELRRLARATEPRKAGARAGRRSRASCRSASSRSSP